MTIGLIDVVGILGVLLIVTAYFLITSRRLTGDDLTYHLLNFLGAWLIMISLWFNWNTPSVLIEAVWIAISSYGIWKWHKQRKRR